MSSTKPKKDELPPIESIRESDNEVKRKKNRRKKKYFSVESASEMIDVASSARNKKVIQKLKEQPMGIVDEKGSN